MTQILPHEIKKLKNLLNYQQ